jgi:hypothetical protein
MIPTFDHTAVSQTEQARGRGANAGTGWWNPEEGAAMRGSGRPPSCDPVCCCNQIVYER